MEKHVGPDGRRLRPDEEVGPELVVRVLTGLLSSPKVMENGSQSRGERSRICGIFGGDSAKPGGPASCLLCRIVFDERVHGSVVTRSLLGARAMWLTPIGW